MLLSSTRAAGARHHAKLDLHRGCFAVSIRKQLNRSVPRRIGCQVAIAPPRQTQELRETASLPYAAFSVEMKVRDYELDQFGVVNNSVYLAYLEHARLEFANAVGFDIVENVRDDGAAMAVMSMNIKYFLPLRSKDAFRATARIVRHTSVRIVFEQTIVKLATDDEPEKVVAAAEVVVVALDKDYKPTRIPHAMMERHAAWCKRMFQLAC